MVGSSLRNSVHRRNHKERGQLAHRSRLGLLEKKKDYVKRARDYHSKQDRLQRLQEKASTRNKDEFYFSMVNTRTEGGVHVQERGNAPIPTDFVKLLKSQDANYIRSMRAAGLKKIANIKEELGQLADLAKPGHISDNSPHSEDESDLDEGEQKILRDAGLLPPAASTSSGTSSKRRRKSASTSGPSHIVFVDDEKAAKTYKPPKMIRAEIEPAHAPQTDQETLGWEAPVSATKKGKRKAAVEDPEAQQAALERQASIQKTAAKGHRTLLLKELSARLERDKALRYAQLELSNQRLRMTNGARKLVGEKKKGEDEGEDDTKVFTFGKDNDDEDDEGGSEKKWKPKVYKWKFERKN